MIKKLFLLLAGLAVSQSMSAAISSPAERKDQIDRVGALLERSVVALDVESSDGLRNPFVKNLPALISVMDEREEEVASSPETLLPIFSEQINPTGIFAINGEYYLIFDEKRLKAGSTIKIDHEGRLHDVILSRVSSRVYTISYGDATIERKLK